MSFEDLLTSLQNCVITEDQAPGNVSQTLGLLFDKLSESSRSSGKRCKERCLEEAVQLLRQLSEAQLHVLEESHLLLLVRLLISMQLQMVNISTACRKVDQMLQHLAKLDHQLVFRETHRCLHSIVGADQVLSFEDLQGACMFLEDSTVGREVWRESFPSLLKKVSQLFLVVLQQESLRDGPLCYTAVKMCLQIFQLLPGEVAPLVWTKEHSGPTVQKILQALMDIILGQCCNRDTCLMAGTAVAMLINTAPESRAGEAAAWSLLQVSHLEPWLLTVGALQVQCCPAREDGVDRLAVSRGLLTCCRPSILLSSHVDATQVHQMCFLLKGLFPLVYALCEEKLDCHIFAFEALTLWLKKVKECLADILEMTGVRLLPDNSSLQQQLIDIIWTTAESPVEGVSEFVRSAFCLLLDLYNMDCEQFCDTEKTLYFTLLQRIIKLPWESKAKYHRLCALLPYLGTDMVLDQYAEIPNHLLKCLSTNHLSPCGSELYRCLIQQQRRELCDASHTELGLADQWARRWRPVLHEALTTDVTLLQNNSSTHLLPCTFQVFPSAVDPLLASLDPFAPGHLHAWACIVSSYRAATGGSPWALQGSSTLETLQLALGSVDDKVRLAALNLLCCSPKTIDTPTPEEMSIMRVFIPQNLNCESSSFRQHFQAGVKRFLVRIRDGCLAHVRGQKGKKKAAHSKRAQDVLEQGIGFVEWLGQLPYSYLAPGHSYQRKKTALLLLSAVLETCTDTWSPDKRKGQPPVNMGSLINCARQRGHWDFVCRTKQLVLISCLEDSTNEIRELSAGLLVRFFPPSFPDDIAAVLLMRTRQLLCSPRVQEAQMGALMAKVLLQKSQEQPEGCGLNGNITVSGGSDHKASCMVRFLVKELEEHYLTAKADMMLAARTKPIHGVLIALQRCLLEAPSSVYDTLDYSLTVEVLVLLENMSLLLLGVLYGDRDTCATEKDAPPSFCEMGNAISSLIAQESGGGQGDGEECVLLSEEHNLVLTCCWVSLKEVGILLGSLVEKILTESKPSKCLLTKEDLTRASKVFTYILLKCRHWGAVEGCCAGFTKFCASLLCSNDPELSDIPAHMLKLGLQVVRSPRSTSVTRRAAGLPMLILCVVSAEEASKARPLLSHSMQTLLETAKTPLPENWDQTLDLPQVCAVHTLQALVRGSGLGVAVLQFAPAVAILSLAMLSSPCWAMRNAALQLYSSLCSRMLGQRPSSQEGGPTQHGMSPLAFFFHYPALQPFLLGELRGAAQDLQGPPNEAKLHLQPSLFPVLTLLAQLQPGVQDSTEALSDFLPPLLQLSASPIYSVRAMASKALVAMTPPSEYMDILIKLAAQLPRPHERFCHNRLHGQLLQIKATLQRALCTVSDPSAKLCEVLSRVEASVWLATEAQRCPLVRAAYLGVADSLRRLCRETYLSKLSYTLMRDLQTPRQELQLGLSSFHQQAIQFLCADLTCACQIWDNFSASSPDLRLSLVTWVVDGRGSQQTGLKEVIQRVLQSNLREALLSVSVEYRRTFLAALVAVMAGGDSTLPQHLPQSAPLEEAVRLECLDLLLGDLEDQRGGPEFLSQALYAASLLLSQASGSSLKISVFQRWCSTLECQRSPDAPEVLRMACAEALCVAGVPLMSHSPLPAITIRSIDTGLYLLQDQSQQVRMKAAHFASMLHHVREGESQRSVYLMQVNRALPLLLDLLLEECWDTPGTLEVLLCHLPQPDLRSVLREASETGGSSLYEQDEANVFAEPSVISAHVLPYLLQMAGKCCESSAVAQRLSAWAEESAAQVLDSLEVCKELQPAETLTPAWLALLTDPRFHGTLCGLFTRTALLLRLSNASDDVRHLCDPSALHMSLRDVCSLLSLNGVHFPSAVTAAVAGELPR
ncbi:thyroid adenoma-associated protein homolog isoform X1 [Anarrhichthys ocellatus]|uniref:thyroid adenoma-associated protein homolog isoform X1 n=2 Tax=Anarrhichthys ocellatus TaxID=433405 RepID=UPI0012EE1DFA|nr:thyroid adenoma-associated protein homolog isoform X1 [Anarrhichthys ocellatus]